MASVFIRCVCGSGNLPSPLHEILRVGLNILPFAEIAIGSVYLNECPRQPYIPIYLIVGGVFGLIVSILSCLPCTKKTKDDLQNKLPIICQVWVFLTLLFVLAWFITGNVWVYSIYKPNYNKNTTNIDPYCNKTLYVFSFLTTMLVYTVMAASLYFSLGKPSVANSDNV